MWCKACGAPLPTTARTCCACGQPNRAGPSPSLPSRLPTTEPGEPCEAGRGMGGLRLRDAGERELIAGTTLTGLETTGERTLFEIEGPRQLHVWIASIAWKGGEREVRRTRRHETPWWQDRLLGRQRLAIEAWGSDHLQLELGQACRDADGTLRVADADEFTLDAHAGTCIRCALGFVGATAMGTRQEVLGLADERRHALCITFPRDALLVPVVAFALTRISPLLSGVRARSA